jgi:hypothetical protein
MGALAVTIINIPNKMGDLCQRKDEGIKGPERGRFGG